MKVRQIVAHNIAGYESVTWDRLQPDLNFLLGRNGAGKSTLLQALALCLSYLAARRTEDLLTRTYPQGSLTLTLSTQPEPITLPFEMIRRSQGHREYAESMLVWQVVENRQPKNTVGDGRSETRQHAMNRYPHAVSELRVLLDGAPDDRKLAGDVLDICRQLREAGRPEDWAWIEQAIANRGPARMRPVSCGQFDVLALALDLARLHRAVEEQPQPVFVILDNPETFLHPACQEPVLDIIREYLPDPQLFVASHSLKLLCHRETKSVFWLSRENCDAAGCVTVQQTRELTGGTQALFFELYGDDVSSAVWNLVRSFERPEYFKFLWECAQPAEARARRNPAADRQMRTLRPHVVPSSETWTILDVRAGHGDMLQALCDWGDAEAHVCYVALDPTRSADLLHRVDAAVAQSLIAPQSRVIDTLADAPSECDAIVLCNVCHEIPLPELAGLLAALLGHHLRRDGNARMVIHEVETLDAGEADFLMWTPCDYAAAFDGIPNIVLKTERADVGGGVPLDTTIITLTGPVAEVPVLLTHLRARFEALLPQKKDDLLHEIDTLTPSPADRSSGFREALRQRRLAFLVAQVTAVCRLERAIQRTDAAASA